MPAPTNQTAKKKAGLLHITWSIIAAFCGVQTDSNLDKDDQQIEDYGFTPYIVIGILLTLLFILVIYGIVQLTLSAVG